MNKELISSRLVVANNNTLVVVRPTTRRWTRFLHSIHIKCQFDITLPIFNTIMAPRNLQSNSSNSGIRRRSSTDDRAELDTEGKFGDFNWQKTMIQSRIMEKVQDVGERIGSQSWLEQIKTLAKERSITSVVVMALLGLCALPVLGFLITVAFTFFGFLFVEGTLLTIGCCLVGGLLFVAACLALPLILVLFVTYLLSSLAFNLCSTTGSKIKQLVVTGESPRRSSNVRSLAPSEKSCTDGSAFLPACITESDSLLEAAVLRRAQQNSEKRLDGCATAGHRF